MLLSTSKSAALLQNVCGKSPSVSIGSDGACWLGLLKTLPDDDGTGWEEVGSGKNYGRINIHSVMSNTYKSHALGETVENYHARRIGNAVDIVSAQAYLPSNPDAQTGADWGTIVGWGLFTASSGGQPYAWGSFDEPHVSVLTHYSFLLRAGYFELYLTDADQLASSAQAG